MQSPAKGDQWSGQESGTHKHYNYYKCIYSYRRVDIDFDKADDGGDDCYSGDYNKNKNSLLSKYRNTLETSLFSTLKSRKV